MFGNVTALVGLHVSGKYRDQSVMHTCSRRAAWAPHSSGLGVWGLGYSADVATIRSSTVSRRLSSPEHSDPPVCVAHRLYIEYRQVV